MFLKFASTNDLIRKLEAAPVVIPENRSGHIRSQKDMDWYCARGYLLVMARNGKLRFPLKLFQGESPDFFLERLDGKVTGLEVTNVTSLEVEAALSTNTDMPWGTDGWEGDQLEKNLAETAMRSLQRKVKKMQTELEGSKSTGYFIV